MQTVSRFGLKHELKTLARCFFPDIQAFFESEEGKRKFEEWKEKHDKNICSR